jgi:hypothetical protein
MAIYRRTIILTNRNCITIRFFREISTCSKGNYLMSANVAEAPEETDTLYNTLADGWTLVTVSGDINGDHTANFLDGILLGVAFNSDPDKSNWNVNADINATTSQLPRRYNTRTNFGQSWT